MVSGLVIEVLSDSMEHARAINARDLSKLCFAAKPDNHYLSLTIRT